MANRIALCGMLTALAMVFSYVEALIPMNFGIPGIKLGLANLVVLTGLYALPKKDVLLIQAARIVLTGFMFGSGMSIIYSLAGGLFSFGVMVLLMRNQSFSRIGVSIAGGVSHNAGQLAIAAVVVRTAQLVYYLPVLIVAGVVTGTLIGIVSDRIAPLWRNNM